MGNELKVNVARLLRQPASRARVAASVPVASVAPEGMSVLDARVPDGAEVDVDLELERLSDGVVASGRLQAPWTADCRRCLGPARGRLVAEVRELFKAQPQAGDDAFPLEGDELDLTPLVREALVLELPLAPLCADDCAGLCAECGSDRNQGDCGCDAGVVDPRWAALDALRPDDA